MLCQKQSFCGITKTSFAVSPIRREQKDLKLRYNIRIMRSVAPKKAKLFERSRRTFSFALKQSKKKSREIKV